MNSRNTHNNQNIISIDTHVLRVKRGTYGRIVQYRELNENQHYAVCCQSRVTFNLHHFLTLLLL